MTFRIISDTVGSSVQYKIVACGAQPATCEWAVRYNRNEYVGRLTFGMITLSRKARGAGAAAGGGGARASVRDKLLPLEVQELEGALPATCRTHWPDHDVLSQFVVTICPDEGYWQGGVFRFSVNVTEEYNMAPPKVKCLTKIWHPNINEEGDICLSLLRQNSIDELGWAPTRRLKDVVWGLNSLFTDLLNFDDPLNIEAADLYQKDKHDFQSMVRKFIDTYAKPPKI